MGAVVVRVAPPSGDGAALAVRVGTRGRRRLDPADPHATPDPAALVAGDGGGRGAAWTVSSAAAAARRRWSGRHPAVGTVVELVLPDPTPAAVRHLLEDARGDLAAIGVRRIDLLTSPADPRLPALRAAGWFTGVVGADVVASWGTGATWRGEPAGPVEAGGRTWRRLRGLRPTDVPSLLATGAAEARGRLAERRHPPATPALEAPPPGSVRHEATRYRTIRRALELVPEGFRHERLLDIGCGDGRVLRVARRLGFTDLSGIEHDPGLVAAARERLGPSASIELGDARTTPIDDRTGVAYLFNPLDEDGVADVAGSLAASLGRRPRPLLVVYVNPRAVGPLLDAGLSIVHLEPQFCVLAT